MAKPILSESLYYIHKNRYGALDGGELEDDNTGGVSTELPFDVYAHPVLTGKAKMGGSGYGADADEPVIVPLGALGAHGVTCANCDTAVCYDADTGERSKSRGTFAVSSRKARYCVVCDRWYMQP